MRVTAVFESEQQAQQAVTELRHLGAGDAHLSVLSRQAEGQMASAGAGLDPDASRIVVRPSGGVTAPTDGLGSGERASSGPVPVAEADLEGVRASLDHDAGLDWHKDIGGAAATGAAAGIGTGALVGLALALIPGVGPLLGAGALAGSLGAGVATGAVAGGAVGSLIGALGEAGYSEEESHYYGSALERGHLMVAVDTDASVPPEAVRDMLRRHGGQSFGLRTGSGGR